MPRSNWGYIVAAVGWLILAGASPPQQEAPTPNAQKQPQITTPALPNYAPYPDRSSDRCYEAKDHEAADLCAQWRAAAAAEKAADTAYWSNWIAGGGALLSFASIVLVVVALGQTRDANRIARNTARHQLRAYVDISDVRLEQDEKDPFRLEIKPVWKNSGQTPAIDASFIVSYSTSDTDLPHDFGYPDSADGTESDPAPLGPDQTRYTPLKSINFRTIQRVRDGEIAIFVWGWAEYTDVFGERRRTEFCRKLMRNPKSSSGVVFIAHGRHNGMDEGCMKQPHNRT